ncbi:short chain enoyl-CoA hydratase /3-hydroxyacyl-CoA dehydrogenase [Hoeflea halophila]|uniref:Short chain enoyl-CoA hydratase /3-hydroxyacyl-CoA dehydrogenase n=1 Tax=Hoeflea halophila TaxID=714899 RepID=A0A286HLZ2_9HYPH|nr:FAD-dependent oxidoreductase [Hoeflea halophila]SOE08791.1 short chain enoyl-CoA hydratase /3-hydroxyacyl-CoA dehydrogenase [Hoeflea halophila]
MTTPSAASPSGPDTRVVEVAISDGHALVTIDNPPVNPLSVSVRKGLMEAVSQVNEAGCKTAAIVCAGRAFVAGGDISEFAGPPPLPHLPDVLNAIEASETPFIAVMHGTVLGGGLELALACAWRIADEKTKFGLPEVNLGLIPGAGGTQRLPRVIGLERAARMAANGKPVNAKTFEDFGGLDRIFSGDPMDALTAFRTALPARPAHISERSVDNADLTALKAEITKSAKGADAPMIALETTALAATLPFGEGSQIERQTHLDLRQSAQSRALRRLFFASRSVTRPERLKAFEPADIRHVAIVGGGLMGAGIAAACLAAGHRVTLLERDAESANAGRSRVEAIISKDLASGRITEARAEARRSAFAAGVDYDAAADADIAIEAVFEDPDVKRAVFKQLSDVMSETALIATNTSYLDPNMISEGMPGPGRFLGLHFFSPANIMKLVEVIGTSVTADQTMATAFAFARGLGKIPVETGVCDGFIGNRILSAYRRQADYMVADGASPYDVDKAMRKLGMPMGPYELQDLTGLQISWANRKRQLAAGTWPGRYVDIADRLCAMGRQGRGSPMKKGWYDHTGGTGQPDPEIEAIVTAWRTEHGTAQETFAPDEIIVRIMAAIVNEANLIVEEGIATSDTAVDIVWTEGYGFPKHLGGPMFWADETGIERMREAFAAIETQSPGSWKASDTFKG